MRNKVARSLSIFLAGFVPWALLWQVIGVIQALLVGAAPTRGQDVELSPSQIGVKTHLSDRRHKSGVTVWPHTGADSARGTQLSDSLRH